MAPNDVRNSGYGAGHQLTVDCSMKVPAGSSSLAELDFTLSTMGFLITARDAKGLSGIGAKPTRAALEAARCKSFASSEECRDAPPLSFLLTCMPASAGAWWRWLLPAAALLLAAGLLLAALARVDRPAASGCCSAGGSMGGQASKRVYSCRAVGLWAGSGCRQCSDGT